MKVTTERTEECIINLTIEVEEAEMKPALEKAARRLSGRFTIPGFRKGHAPYNVVQRMLGEDYIYQEALEEMAPEWVEDALKQQEIKPYASPEITKVDLRPTKLTVSVPLEPQVELGDYRSIHIEREPAVVSDDDVTQEIDEMRHQHATTNEVDRPVQLGDVITGDYSITIGDGQPQEYKDTHVHVPTAENEGIVGLSERLIGVKAGDTVEFDSVMAKEPGADQAAEPDKVHLRLSVKKVEEEVLPEANDEFAVMVGDYENLEQLRAEVRQRLEKEAKERSEENLTRKAIEALTALTSIKYPPAALEQEIDMAVASVEQSLRSRRLSLEGYLKAMNLTKEQFRERQRPDSERTLKEGLALRAFVNAEDIEVKEGELAARTERAITSMADGQDYTQLLRSDSFQRRLHANMLTRRALSRLISIVTGEPEAAEEEIPAEEMPAPTVNVVERQESGDQPETAEAKEEKSE